MAGIKETKELVEFAITFGNAIAQATKDGKFNFSDISLFIPVAIKAPTAFTGISDVDEELEDLSEDELHELHSVVEGFVSDDSNTEIIAEQSFRVGLELSRLVALLVGDTDTDLVD